ncbi:hypothetical protein Val02_70920 [Virgisporangium aliadipatigenens]|uniref:Exo-alpha-sialidase n=1 Tax=Virgisporangium aliadipatigenens TaxID=741659 RepID=A0A8J3YRM7_9ACTN|nr:sialidase family protein [Virgisporangium aliadipatigenens]GIJ50206.1 hypothetical protein Val02_70920 [Virgisporangium aliadipatigenens]
MTDVQELLNTLATEPAPPSPHSARQLYAAGRQRHRRRTVGKLAAVATGVAVVVAAVSVPLVIDRRPPRGDAPAESAAAPKPLKTWPTRATAAVGSGDNDHLYVLSDMTPPARGKDPAPPMLYGSDDGGATWTERSRDLPKDGKLTVLDARTLVVSGDWRENGKYKPSARLSGDGGRTWKTLSADAPQQSWPEGGWTSCLLQTGQYCTAMGFQPGGAGGGPLANQPGVAGMLEYAQLDAKTAVAAGFLEQRGAVSVTVDGGRTWNTHRFEEPASTTTFVPLVLGTGAALTAVVRRDGGIRVYRSTDAGRSWQQHPDPAGLLSRGGTYVPSTRGAVVTRDGRHIVTHVDASGVLRLYRSDAGHARYEHLDATGLPTTEAPRLVTLPGGMLVAINREAAFQSADDGATWQPLPIE